MKNIRMMQQLSLSYYKILSFFLLSLVFLISGTIYYFWHQGLLDSGRNQDILNGSYFVESLSKDNVVKNIQQTVLNEDNKKALVELGSLDKRLLEIHQIVPVKSYGEIHSDIPTVKKAITNLISFPHTTKIWKVFSQKNNEFNKFVVENEWRTLTRMSQRITSQVNSAKDIKKLPAVVKIITEDLERMGQITRQSVLKEGDKKSVINRLDSLQVEMKMFDKLLQERRFFREIYSDFQNNYNNWFDKVKEELLEERLQREKLTTYFFYALLSFLSVTLFFFIMGYAIRPKLVRSSQKALESEIERLISEDLLLNQVGDQDKYSEKFKYFINNMGEYLDKRMGFGSIFQESLPIPSLLLDQNLNVLWSNSLFKEEWKLQDDSTGYTNLNWDYLVKMTNLRNDDPVIIALNEGVAGIYQMKLLVGGDAKGRPFEMYVSPTMYNEQKRVMLFFYPLSSLEQTIDDQAQSLMNPISNTLTAISQSDDFSFDIESFSEEFKIAGIEQIYAQFKEMLDIVTQKMSSKDDLNEALSDRLEEAHYMTEKHSNMLNFLFSKNEEQINHLKNLRDKIIQLSEISEEVFVGSEQKQDMILELFGLFFQETKQVEGLKIKSLEVSQALPNPDEVKRVLKNLRSDVNDSRQRLSSSVRQLDIFVQKKQALIDQNRLEAIIKKIHSESDYLSDYSKQYERHVLNLEIILSKGHLLIGDLVQFAEKKCPDLVPENYFKNTQNRLQQDTGILNEQSDRYGEIEEEMIQNISSLYGSLKSEPKDSSMNMHLN